MVVYVLKGHDFSRAVKRPEMSRALAPEGRLFFKFNPTAGHESMTLLAAASATGYKLLFNAF